MTMYVPDTVSIKYKRHDTGFEVCSFCDDDVIGHYVHEDQYNQVVEELKQLKERTND